MPELCERCGKPAKVNLQKIWVRWEYNPETEEFSEDCKLLDIPPEENIFLCEKCAEDSL